MLFEYLPFILIVLISAGILLLMLWLLRQHKSQLARQFEQKYIDLQSNIEDIKNELDAYKLEVEEVRAGNIGLGHTIKSLSTKLQNTELNQQALADMDPTVKLYNKATKLIQSGANVRDLVDECGLPQAEAELLMNIHKSNPSSIDI